MVHPEVQEVASVFRGELRWMFGPYPALIPDMSWPSVGILDALCRRMCGRRDWTEGEKIFIAGAAAHLGELVEGCWRRFADDVQVKHNHDGIVCAGKGEDGSVYEFPLEKALKAALEDPAQSRWLPGNLPYKPASGRHVLELFALTACLGLNPAGQGSWTRRKIDYPTQRVDAVLPLLAAMCAAHYARLHPNEPLGQKPDLYRRLIWPLTLCEGARSYQDAGGNLLSYLDGALAVIRGALPLLRNLARFPSATVRGAALTCLVLDERVSISGELVEIAADHFQDRAPEFRLAAIKLAAERSRNIDWLNGGVNGKARFRYERQLSLLPLVYLSYERCVEAANRELTCALVALSAEDAACVLEHRIAKGDRSPDLLFQQAMLRRAAGEPDEAEQLMAEVVRQHPDALNCEFYMEAGVGALALDQLEDAIARLERARSMGTGLRVTTELGRAYARAGRHDDAAQVFGEAIARGYLPSQVLVNRAELNRELGRQEGYSRDLAAAAALYPFNPDVVDRVMASYVDA